MAIYSQEVEFLVVKGEKYQIQIDDTNENYYKEEDKVFSLVQNGVASKTSYSIEELFNFIGINEEIEPYEECFYETGYTGLKKLLFGSKAFNISIRDYLVRNLPEDAKLVEETQNYTVVDGRVILIDEIVNAYKEKN